MIENADMPGRSLLSILERNGQLQFCQRIIYLAKNKAQAKQTCAVQKTKVMSGWQDVWND